MSYKEFMEFSVLIGAVVDIMVGKYRTEAWQ